MEYIHRHRINKIFRLKLAVLFTAIAMVIEFAGGIFSNSLALISDAGHMLTHLFALGMSYFAAVLVTRPVTKRHTYGLFRAEVLAAFINGIALIFVAGYLGYEAVIRLVNPEIVRVREMFFTALLGLSVNAITIVLLFKAGSHDLNIRSALLHEFGDIISSIAVVIGAVFICYTGNYLIDSLLSFFICMLILIWAVSLLVESAHILLEAVPKHLDIDMLVKMVKAEIPQIHEVHHVHVWTITTLMYALTAHIVIDDCHVSKANEILMKLNDLLKRKFSIEHTNIQFECKNK